MLRSVFRCFQQNSVAGQRNMSQSSLSGKVAIVTASTEGIGLAAAQSLGKRGAHVVVSSRRQTNVDKAVALLQSQNIQVTGTTCHVGVREDREKLVQMTLEKLGGIDILVSNAAVNPFFGNILESTEDVWDKVLSVNVKAPFLLTKLVAPHMENRGGGNVVFVSSVAGYQPITGLGPYNVSKTALLGLTQALAPELAQSNIRVNCVAPGLIKTRFSSEVRTTHNSDCTDTCQHPRTFFLSEYLSHVLLVCFSYGKMKPSWINSRSSSALKGELSLSLSSSDGFLNN
uniref:Dehydrogenase/reductase (SDR family) member 4 n=1 Tax=Cynoglossus semilaevis TaxID=244447 RepID=A0A3P8UTB0_CYNSE